MDVPDRIITADNTRLWRTEAVVHILDGSEDFTEFRFVNPVPVLDSSGVIRGWAALEVRGKELHASISMEYSLPERLDAEAGPSVWALPRVRYTAPREVRDEAGVVTRVFTIAFVDALQLRHDCNNPSLIPLGAPCP